jgi:hypothetical protein
VRRYEGRLIESRKIALWGLLIALAGSQQGFATSRASFALNENLCFWMVSVESGQTVAFTRRLEAGTPYRLFVMGDSYAVNLDVAVLDPLGRGVASRGDSPREALLRFTPSATGTYTLRLTVKKSQGTARCSALLLPEQGDWHAMHFHWGDALKKVQQLLLMLEERGLVVELASEGVCMVGGIVPAGRTVDFGQLSLDSQTYLWAVVGDSRARSVQMRLQRDNKDASLGGGQGKPLALCLASQTGFYTPQVALKDADTEAFVIVAIFKVKQL